MNAETIAAGEHAAQDLAERQQWRDAAKALLRVAKAQPRKLERWLQIAQWQRQGGNAREAAETLETALRLNARKSKPLSSRGELELRQALCEAHLESQNWDAAIEACKSLLEIAPGHHFVREMLATAYLQTGELPLAEQVMRALLQDSPRDPFHRLRLATLLQLQGKLGDATREFERVLFLYPDFPLAAEARDALETLDRMQTQQVLIMASEQLTFRRELETDMNSALEALGFYLSESGFDSLKHIIADGEPGNEPRSFIH